MSAANKTDPEMADAVRSRIAALHQLAPDSIGDLFNFQLEACCAVSGEYTLRCTTQPWMRNPAGTLHGGICATILDQAMGYIVYCIKPGSGIAPTLQLQTVYHRPLIPGEDVRVQVRVVSVTKSMLHLTASAATAAASDRVCVTASAIYYYKEP